MIYKLLDGTRVRVTRVSVADVGEFLTFQSYRFTPEKEILNTEILTGEAAERRLSEVYIADAMRFAREFGGHGPLAHTGLTDAARATILGATVVGVATLCFVAAPSAQAPDYPRLSDVATAPVVTPSPVTSEPYKPEPRETRRTDRDGVRETLTPSPSPTVVKPSKTPATKRPIATPPADIRISYYRSCGADFQACVDAGALTHYAGNILAGHNYMGYQWLSRVAVGRTVRVISGPMAGTYKVYGHLYIDRQGGRIPAFAGSPDLVLQTCEGDGTGFSLLHRA
ncbi:hypothetical protein ABZ445_16330 [Streptomyces chartreusis]|uniref:hypothetical protein n=1 Tax=Streptomyces chartreusis TaxID=1969 RepID=UPI0033CEBB91